MLTPEQRETCGQQGTHFWPAGSLSGHLPSHTLYLTVLTHKADSGICEKICCSSFAKIVEPHLESKGRGQPDVVPRNCKAPRPAPCLPAQPFCSLPSPPPSQNIWFQSPPDTGATPFYGQSPQLSFRKASSILGNGPSSSLSSGPQLPLCLMWRRPDKALGCLELAPLPPLPYGMRGTTYPGQKGEMLAWEEQVGRGV